MQQFQFFCIEKRASSPSKAHTISFALDRKSVRIRDKWYVFQYRIIINFLSQPHNLDPILFSLAGSTGGKDI